MSQTRTMTLTEFLLARIAEDERLAAEYPDLRGDWPPPWEVGLYYEDGVAMTLTVTSARVLAECAAKRRIVEIATAQIRLAADDAGGWDNWHDMAQQTLYALAVVYADHADYKPTWAA